MGMSGSGRRRAQQSLSFNSNISGHISRLFYIKNGILYPFISMRWLKSALINEVIPGATGMFLSWCLWNEPGTFPTSCSYFIPHPVFISHAP